MMEASLNRESTTFHKDYVIAVYIRLSREDKDILFQANKKESNSITNQRALILDFIRSHEEFSGCKVIEKCDDGFSGVLFENRPQFMEMIELAKRGKVNCIIVKDFSRFGRNYLELGNYLEQVFPFLGVRFISVNDNYDSECHKGGTGGLDVVFKNIVYDYYSREQSKKQKLILRKMAEQGQYNAPCALYGYRKDKKDKHHLVVNEKTANIVREIFDMMVAGRSALSIAKSLNERHVKCPSEFQHQEGYTRKWNYYESECFWTDNRIRELIKDERYTGTMVSLKTERKTVRGKKKWKSASEWIRVENTHEGIVSYDVYLKALSMLKQQDFIKSGKTERNIYHCGYCGRKLQRYGKGRIVCFQRMVREECECRKANINKKKADETVLLMVQQQMRLFLEEEKLERELQNRTITVSVMEETQAVERAISSMQGGWMVLYEKYSDGKITREEFAIEKKKHVEEMNQMKEKLEELRGRQKVKLKEGEEGKRMVSQAVAYAEQLELTEEMKEKMIDRVLVYSGDRMEVVWRFQDRLNIV